MLSRDELLKLISNTIGKTKVLELSSILNNQQFNLRDLIGLTFDTNKDIAFRSAWILENTFFKDQALYENDLEYLLSRIKDVKYASCQRHYAKILSHLTQHKTIPSIKNKIQNIDMEPIVEKCFDWMIDPKVKVAVKVFAADVLFNLHNRYSWIAEELANQIKFLMRNGSPAIQSRGKKLLAGLKT